MISALAIQVKGIVQGVGFRPFVYRCARRFLVNGWVENAADGVNIHAEGEEKLLDEFVLELSENPPAAAKVESIELSDIPLEGYDTFEIRFSDDASVQETTLVSPDLATCDDCTRELFDPTNRRYRYPFINCTNCGPRFTIIQSLPYDRAQTSMADFSLCDECADEYRNPDDRRFHAQPDACFACGPHISWKADGEEDVAWGVTRAQSDEIIARAVEWLHAGRILAVKGLGGFHLVCDADNPDAIAKLRRRKHREGKAFACMVETVQQARMRCSVSEEEQAVLTSPARPIVLLRKRRDVSFAAGLADALPELGLMLPATPLQQLLLHDFDGMLVMTSGNVHDEPIQIDDREAQDALFGIADAFIGNDRAIRARYDDSVVRLLNLAGDTESVIQMIRRARGYAPRPIGLPAAVSAAQESRRPVLLATGPEQKNTFCLTRDDDAFVSQHIGDMENAETFDAWLEAKATYEHLFNLTPASLVCDRHPEYLTSKWAHRQGLPVEEAQHHHAHIVSVMAENNLEGPVCGIAFDGTGYGEDGAIWGGEILLANLTTFERFANFAYVPMPGGAAAIKHPLRMAYGVLWEFDLLDHPAAQDALAGLGDASALCGQMIEKGLNTPMTSSVGRLFDAASALLGLCVEPRYEGEGAVLLESAIDDADVAAQGAFHETEQDEAYRIAVTKNTASQQSTALDTSIVLFDAAPAFKALLDDKAKGVPVASIARRFHDAFIGAILQAAQLVDALYGIRTIALSGGVFMNRYLTEHALSLLASEGFRAAVNCELPPNDACISFGQAVIGLARKEGKTIVS